MHAPPHVWSCGQLHVPQVDLHSVHVKEALTVVCSALWLVMRPNAMCCLQVDLHGMHVEEALTVLDRHLTNLGGLGSPSDILLQVPVASAAVCPGLGCTWRIAKRVRCSRAAALQGGLEHGGEYKCCFDAPR